jgi:hypothetical protein
MDKDLLERLPCYVQLLRNWYSEEERKGESGVQNGNRTGS